MDALADIDNQIAELDEEIEWSGAGPESERKRAGLRAERRDVLRQRVHARADTRVLPGISTARLIAARAEQRHLNAVLADIARTVEGIRKGVPASALSGFRFEKYDTYERDGDDFESMHVSMSRSARYEPEWLTVAFPISYLDGDYVALETTAQIERVAAERLTAEEVERERAARQEARDRAELERLKALFPE